MAPVEVTPEGYLESFEHMSYHLCSKHTQNNDTCCHGNQQGGGDNEVELQQNTGPDAGQYKMRPVWEWGEIKPGMFCYVKYLGFWHAILITSKRPEQETVKAIHFAWPSVFSRRVIKDDDFVVNLGRNDLWEVYIPQNKRVPPDVALERARQKIGQNGFNMFWRRSSHVIRECVEA